MTRRQILGSCAAAFCGLLILVALLITYGQRFQRVGFTKSLYFFALITISLCAAGFLFGILKNSTAGVHWKWAEVGGPAALAVILIVLGKSYAPAESFVTVFHVEDELGAPIRSGSLLVDFGRERARLGINPEGQAQFNETPTQLGTNGFKVIPEIEGYVAASDGLAKMDDDHVVTFKVRKALVSSSLFGQVFDLSGTKPLGHAKLVIATEKQEFETESNDLGNFRFQNLPIKTGALVNLSVSAAGKLKYSGSVLNNSPLNLNSTQ